MATPPKRPSPPRRPPFSPRATTVFRVSLVAGGLGLASAGYATWQYYHSPYWNRIGFAPGQPVLFSHRHHAGELRLDCRNCHSTVESSAFAGMPSTHTCLACHSQIFTDTAMLQPVVASGASDQPLAWTRVTALPDYVYFNHSIHLAKGVGCTTCHGDVGNLALMAKTQPLTMRWCVDCHRDPGPRLQPREELFSPHPPPARRSPAEAAALLATYGVHREHLTNCSTCHR